MVFVGRNETLLQGVAQSECINFRFFLDVAGSERYRCLVELLNSGTDFISVLSVMIVTSEYGTSQDYMTSQDHFAQYKNYISLLVN